MEIDVSSGDISAYDVPAVVVNLFEGVESPGGATGSVDQALDEAISRLIADGETKGKRGEVTLIHTLGKMATARVLVLGLGKAEEFDADSARSVAGVAARRLRQLGVTEAATIAHGSGVGGLKPHTSAKAIAEGTLLGLYRFDKYKKKAEDASELRRLTIVEFDSDKVAGLEDGVSEGSVFAEAVIRCRDLVNEPANRMTPTGMAEAALEVATEIGIAIDVLDRADMEALGMGALLGVSQGSDEPPKLIVLRYQGDPSRETSDLGIIGKGITFDSGGISIKPSANMGRMKGDMAGGAAVICAMQTIGRLKPKINVTGIVAATENMPGGRAQRPGDVVTTMSGKTIEIDNTDAEGRLLLADALAYARSLGIERIVDVATLTGAIKTALGTICSGAFGNDQGLIDEVIQAGREEGERAWQFPMFDEYKKQYKSDVADLKNTGGPGAGSIVGAQIIGEFADGASWVHLDIAGTSMSNTVQGYTTKGATGVGVRTLARLAVNLAREEDK